MKSLFVFLGRLFLLLYLQLRRLVPRAVRHAVAGAMGVVLPSFVQRPFGAIHQRAEQLEDRHGLRGMTASFMGHFQESWFLFHWLWTDDCRPSLKYAILPTALKFFATLLQASAFAIIAGYISLSANDWTLVWNDYSILLEPNIQNAIMLAGGVFVAYVAFAILNYIGGNEMLKVGLLYQEVLFERMLVYYRRTSQTPGTADYLDPSLLLSVLNTEARYLGRAIIMLYNMVYQLVFVVVGFTVLVRLEPNFALLCVGFIVLASLFQVGVFGKSLVDTRSMLEFTDGNTQSLRRAIQTVSISPQAFSVDDTEIKESLRVDEIQRYNHSYYDRLRIGLFAAMIPQILFAFFVAGIFSYAIYAVTKGGLDTSSAIQYVVSLRFFLGGVTGLLTGMVSIIALKPYFDNYIRIDPASSEAAWKAPPKPQFSEHEATALSVITGDGETIKVDAGQTVSIVVNKGAITWFDLSLIADTAIASIDGRRVSVQHDIGLVHTELPLISSDPLSSFGLPAGHVIQIDETWPDFLKEGLDGLMATLEDLESFPKRASKIWTNMPLPHLVCGMLYTALMLNKPILFFSERAYRAIPERQRLAINSGLFKDRFLIIHHTTVPQLIVEPAPLVYILLDKTGVIDSFTPETLLTIDPSIVDSFSRTSFSPDTGILWMDEEF